MPHESTHRSKKFQDWDTGYEDYISAYGSESMIDNLPGLFSQTHKAPPPPVIFEATEHNIPMNEAMSNYGNNQMEQEFDPFFNEDFMTYDDPVSMLEEIDPDMLDKIVYQRGMEDAGSSSSMTPWGPTIDQEFMGIAEELLPGLSGVDSLEHFRDAEELLSTYPTELEGLATNIETLAEDQYHLGEEEQIYAAAGDQIAQQINPDLQGNQRFIDINEDELFYEAGNAIHNAVEFFKEQGEGTFFPKEVSAGIKIESEDDPFDEDAPFDIGDTGEKFKIGLESEEKEVDRLLKKILQGGEKDEEVVKPPVTFPAYETRRTPLREMLDPILDGSLSDVITNISNLLEDGSITTEDLSNWVGTYAAGFDVAAIIAGHDAGQLRKLIEDEWLEGISIEERIEKRTEERKEEIKKEEGGQLLTQQQKLTFSDLAEWIMQTYNLTEDKVATEGWEMLSLDTSEDAGNIMTALWEQWSESKLWGKDVFRSVDAYVTLGLENWLDTKPEEKTAEKESEIRKIYSEYGISEEKVLAGIKNIMDEQNVTEEEATNIYQNELQKQVPSEPTEREQVKVKKDGTPEDPRAGGEEGLNMSEDLQKMFYQKMYSQPGAGRWDVQKLLPSLFNQTKALFFLSEGDNFYNRHGLSIFKDEAAYQADENYRGYIEKAYTGYLNKYLTDPMNERAGDKLRMGLDDMSRIFIKHRNDPDFTTWTPEDIDKFSWMDGIFGEDESGLKNRDNLVKLNITNGGMGYYSQQIHKSAQKVMDHFRKMGRGEAEIFQYMTKGRRQAEIAPEQIDTETDADIDAAMIAEEAMGQERRQEQQYQLERDRGFVDVSP